MIEIDKINWCILFLYIIYNNIYNTYTNIKFNNKNNLYNSNYITIGIILIENHIC